MKNVIIVLICVAVFGAVGFMATAEISRRSQNAQQEADEAKLPPVQPGSLEEMARVSQCGNVSMENLRKRQNYAFIGAGVGAGAGLVIGLGTGMLLGKKKKTV
jgi:hypothetical protein